MRAACDCIEPHKIFLSELMAISIVCTFLSYGPHIVQLRSDFMELAKEFCMESSLLDTLLSSLAVLGM